MGRTISAATQLIFDQIDEAEPLYMALRRSDQLEMDELFNSVIQHKAALAHSGTLHPLEIMLLLALLELKKSVKHMQNDFDEKYQRLLKLINPHDETEIVEGLIVDETIHGLAA